MHSTRRAVRNVQAKPVTYATHSQAPPKSLLHVCNRDVLRPLRDQVLRLSGYRVESTPDPQDAIKRFSKGGFDLVLIDVEGEVGVPEAEALCSEVKTQKPHQLVAFVCNWRVAILSDCPDEIVRTEFDPQAFVDGVQQVLANH